MKNTINIIVMLTVIIFLFLPDMKAQTEGPDTVDIKLSVRANIIQIDSILTSVNKGDRIRFYTEDSYSFIVIIDNYDHFIDNPGTPLMINVTAGNPIILTIDSPPKDDNVKNYSVGVINPKKPIPIPPEAPPRIIIK